MNELASERLSGRWRPASDPSGPTGRNEGGAATGTRRPTAGRLPTDPVPLSGEECDER